MFTSLRTEPGHDWTAEQCMLGAADCLALERASVYGWSGRSFSVFLLQVGGADVHQSCCSVIKAVDPTGLVLVVGHAHSTMEGEQTVPERRRVGSGPGLP